MAKRVNASADCVRTKPRATLPQGVVTATYVDIKATNLRFVTVRIVLRFLFFETSVNII